MSKESKEFAKIVTANRLRDGAVVFLAAQGQWSEKTDAAVVAKTSDEEAGLLATGVAAVKACEVVDVNAIEIASLTTREPSRLRERIRQIGPTVRPDLGRAV
ncbi:MAG: DUF2849 domain-containing protein [Rhodospirillaceae bacterium]|nr:DUF2849 domain-containing protein [Rhodospirillaceae bacterium]